MMNTTLSPRPNAAPSGTRITLKQLKRHRWLILAIAAAMSGAGVLINSSVYAAVYQCQTENIDNMLQCHKYQISPTFMDLGIVSSTACPNNPPSNCP